MIAAHSPCPLSPALWSRAAPGAGVRPRPLPGRHPHGNEVMRFRTRIPAARVVPCWVLLAGALGLAACATRGDVEQVQQANQVQERRIQALEQTTPEAISRAIASLRPQLDDLEQRLRALSGRSSTQREEGDRLSREQEELAGTIERMQAELKTMARTLEREQKRYATRGVELEKALDAVHGQLTAMEALLKSRLADLPQKTQADRAYREAFYRMVGGELDVAAGAFAEFRSAYSDEPRVVDALYREGQAYFLLRQYSKALIPFLELVEKHPRHALAVDAKWMLARSLEETGDLKLARDFYAQLIADNTPHKADATRRVYLIDRLYPREGAPPSGGN